MSWRLRVLFFYCVTSAFTVAFFFIICFPLQFIKIGYRLKYQIAKLFSEVFIFLAKFICGIDYLVSGLEKLPEGPCIVLANHQSFWDNMFMQIIIPEHSWIIKQELFDIPFFGWALKVVDPIAVDRSASISVKQILRDGAIKIRQGQWLVIFPEATRVKPGQTIKFKPSAVKLAQMTKVPIVLIAHNAGVFWPKGFWIQKPGVVSVKIIDVIEVEEIVKNDTRLLTENIQHIIDTEKQKLAEGA